MISAQKLFTTETTEITETKDNFIVTTQPCHCEPFFLAKQSPVYQASLTAWGLLRRKERSSQ
jgi:hypothetical protein